LEPLQLAVETVEWRVAHRAAPASLLAARDRRDRSARLPAPRLDPIP